MRPFYRHAYGVGVSSYITNLYNKQAKRRNKRVSLPKGGGGCDIAPPSDGPDIHHWSHIFFHFAVAPPPINVFIPRSTTSSFTVTWSAAAPANLNGNITGYDIQYQSSLGEELVEAYIEGKSLVGEYIAQELPKDNTYTVRVSVRKVMTKVMKV